MDATIAEIWGRCALRTDIRPCRTCGLCHRASVRIKRGKTFSLVLGLATLGVNLPKGDESMNYAPNSFCYTYIVIHHA